MRNKLIKIVLTFTGILVLLFFFIRFLEYRSLYHPYRTIEGTPKDIGLDYEEVFITTKDGVSISAWFIPSEAGRAMILLSHGNGGNISHRLEKISMLHNIGAGVLVFDYRGYGMSSGRPSEDGLYFDVYAVYDYLVKVKNIARGKIVGYGESLGGAVTAELAHKHKLGGIILEGSFSSVRDMAEIYFPFIPSFVYKTEYNTMDKLKDVTTPKLIFHGVDDRIVPFEQGRKLYENAAEPKEFVELQGGHNDSFIVSEDVFTERIRSFIGKL